uniref:Protein kinase domain-containing protein n=1 Tax=Arcella intermedia TaxID=1963864 RepID=A0A6B2LDG9_9EUKA
MKLDQANVSSVYKIKRELTILDSMRDERTIKLLHYFRDDSAIYFVTHFYERGSLRNMIKMEQLDSEIYFTILQDICSALVYLHNNDPQILHLDLKPENVLISGIKDTRAVLCDFGLSETKKESASKSVRVTGGTFFYMAPDYQLYKTVTHKADIFSLGIMMWEMLSYELPYSHIPGDSSALPVLVKEGERPTWDDMQVPDDLKNLIITCWDANPKQRDDAVELKLKLEQISDLPLTFGKDIF